MDEAEKASVIAVTFSEIFLEEEILLDVDKDPIEVLIFSTL